MNRKTNKNNRDLWKLEFIFIINKDKLENDLSIELKKGNYQLDIYKHRDEDFVYIYLNYKKNNISIYQKKLEISQKNNNLILSKNNIMLVYVTALIKERSLIHDYKNFNKLEVFYGNTIIYTDPNISENKYKRSIIYVFDYNNFEHDLTFYEMSILKMETLYL